MSEAGSRSGDAPRRVPVHLWVVAVLALLWSLMGAFDYLATQLKLDFYMSAFSEEQLEYFYGIPAWAVAGWAFGVWGSLVGSIGLLVRRGWSVWAFAASLAGLIVSSVYSLGLSNGLELMSTGEVVFTVVIWAVTIFLLVYSKAQANRDVLI
jgi:hypothetical protein